MYPAVRTEAEDEESFQIGSRWFKPNYHAHIVFDWMNHDTGKSRKLNDEDMTEMQSLASDILLMERGQSRAVTGKEHLERNDSLRSRKPNCNAWMLQSGTKKNR